MPDVYAAAGDLIEVSITAPNALSTLAAATGHPWRIIARMMTKGNDGKWEVELPGDPPMRGKVSIDGYEWSHEGRCWRKKKVVEKGPAMAVAPLPKAHR